MFDSLSNVVGQIEHAFEFYLSLLKLFERQPVGAQINEEENYAEVICEATDEEAYELPRATRRAHSVKGYVRGLPENHVASQKQIDLALMNGILLKRGETFVRDYSTH